jgi:hypothetical protein
MWRGVVLSGRLRLLAGKPHFTGKTARLLAADKEKAPP